MDGSKAHRASIEAHHALIAHTGTRASAAVRIRARVRHANVIVYWGTKQTEATRTNSHTVAVESVVGMEAVRTAGVCVGAGDDAANRQTDIALQTAMEQAPNMPTCIRSEAVHVSV